MAKLKWDEIGKRFYETGVDQCVLYKQVGGAYPAGVAWNGITAITDSPSGAEANPQYADNIKYLNLVSAEEYGCTVEAFTYPDEWAECDGTAEPSEGVYIAQQTRSPFGLVWRTKIGNDTDGDSHGYKLHLMWNGLAAPSEKAYNTINESPEAMAMSWEVTTTPTAIETKINNKSLKPTAKMTIDSTKVDPAALTTLEEALFGTDAEEAHLPNPDEVIAMFPAG